MLLSQAMSSNSPKASLPVPAILLAAGASTRLGQPKQLLRLPAFGGETLLDRTARLALEAGATPVFVVLGAYVEEIERSAHLAQCDIVRNAEWPEGMASSLRAGIQAVIEKASEATGVLLMVGDQPALTAEHLRQLLAIHEAQPEIIAASYYANRSGVPVVVPRSLFPALLQLTGDQGARAILQQTEFERVAVPFPGGEWDIDTTEDLRR